MYLNDLDHENCSLSMHRWQYSVLPQHFWSEVDCNKNFNNSHVVGGEGPGQAGFGRRVSLSGSSGDRKYGGARDDDTRHILGTVH